MNQIEKILVADRSFRVFAGRVYGYALDLAKTHRG